MGIWKKVWIFATDKPKLHYVKSMPRRLSPTDWEVEIQAICDMPTVHQEDFVSLLQVTLTSLDGSMVLVNESQMVSIEPTSDIQGKCPIKVLFIIRF